MLRKIYGFEKLVFSIGFLIGVIIACLLTKSEIETDVQTSCEIPGSSVISYNTWFSEKRVRKYAVDYDELSYGKTKTEYVISEASYLYNSVRLQCVVFVKKEKNAIAIKNSWGKYCNDIIFFGLENSKHISVILSKPKSSWQYLCDAVRYLWQNQVDFHWILFTPDDIYAIPENLRYYVASLNYNESHYLGHDITFWGQMYNIGEAGYVLSKGALRALATRFNSSESCLKSGKYWKNEDFYLGKYLGEMGITPANTKDESGCYRFQRYNLNYVMNHQNLKASTQKLSNQINAGCYSDHIITFNGIEPDKLYLYDYLLYRVKVFRHGGILGNHPPPVTVSEEEVWREFVREEGLGDLEDISAKQYFELWQRKIPSPEVLNALLRQQSQGTFSNNGISGPENQHR